MKRKLHELKQNYKVLKVGWFCISCEKPVTSHKNDNIDLRSYFIRCNPYNGRMCVNCMAETIREGSW